MLQMITLDQIADLPMDTNVSIKVNVVKVSEITEYTDSKTKVRRHVFSCIIADATSATKMNVYSTKCHSKFQNSVSVMIVDAINKQDFLIATVKTTVATFGKFFYLPPVHRMLDPYI